MKTAKYSVKTTTLTPPNQLLLLSFCIMWIYHTVVHLNFCLSQPPLV